MRVRFSLVDAVEGDLEVAAVKDDCAGESHVFTPSRHLRMVDIVKVVSGHTIVLHDEAGLAAFEEKLDALVLVFRVTVARELKDAPRSCSIHFRVGPAKKRGGARTRGRRPAVRRRNVLGPINRT
jgi:hypothetical protein